MRHRIAVLHQGADREFATADPHVGEREWAGQSAVAAATGNEYVVFHGDPPRGSMVLFAAFKALGKPALLCSDLSRTILRAGEQRRNELDLVSDDERVEMTAQD